MKLLMGPIEIIENCTNSNENNEMHWIIHWNAMEVHWKMNTVDFFAQNTLNLHLDQNAPLPGWNHATVNLLSSSAESASKYCKNAQLY